MFSKSAENGFGAVKLLQSDLYRRARRVLSQWISIRSGGDEKSQNLNRDVEWNPTLAQRTRKDGVPGQPPFLRITTVTYIQLTGSHHACIIVYTKMKLWSLTGMTRRTERTSRSMVSASSWRATYSTTRYTTACLTPVNTRNGGRPSGSRRMS